MTTLSIASVCIQVLGWYMVFKVIYNYFDNAKASLHLIYRLIVKTGNLRKRLEIDLEKDTADIEYYHQEILKFSGDKKNEIADILFERKISASRLKKRISVLNGRILYLNDIILSNRLVNFFHNRIIKRYGE